MAVGGRDERTIWKHFQARIGAVAKDEISSLPASVIVHEPHSILAISPLRYIVEGPDPCNPVCHCWAVFGFVAESNEKPAIGGVTSDVTVPG